MRKRSLAASLSRPSSARSSGLAACLGGCVAAGLLAGSGVGLAACSSSTPRDSFVEDAGATPAETPIQNPSPDPDPQPEPDPVVSDGGPPPDADTCQRAAPSHACGVAPQCGCTLAETCDVVDGAGTVACVTAGTAPMGAPCIATPGCAVGLTCIFGTCHAFCDHPGAACTLAKTGGCLQGTSSSSDGGAVPNLAVCRVACDLRDVNGCGGTTSAGTGVCTVDEGNHTDCVLGGTRAAGQTCDDVQRCGPGTECTTMGASSDGTCRTWCRVGTNDCGGTTTCTGFTTAVKIGTTEYGVCP